MPIRPDYRQFYGREWRTIWRPFLADRSGNRCESCGKPNGGYVLTLPGGLWYDERDRQWKAPSGILPHDLFLRLTTARVKRIRVNCGGAHINHDPSDHRPDNLAWWCDHCHLRHDRAKHAETAHITRATRKDAGRPILVAISAEA